MLPAHGVYAVCVSGDGLQARGIANLGAAPTFGIDKPLLEVHLIDFDGDLYGRHTTVEFLHKLRDIRRFDSSEELQKQIQKDLDEFRSYEL
jgi:riboflavin kinase/FMN adenylyltransferase